MRTNSYCRIRLQNDMALQLGRYPIGEERLKAHNISALAEGAGRELCTGSQIVLSGNSKTDQEKRNEQMP